MAELRITDLGLAAAARGLCSALDATGAAGALEFYDQEGGALLARLRFNNPAAVEFTGGVVKFSGITPELDAPGKGRATWARAMDSDGNVIFECDVGQKGKGAIIQLEEDDFVRKGDLLRVSEFSMTIKQAG